MPGSGGWHIPCVCGAVVITATRECTCPKCGLILNVEAWGGEPVNVQTSERANAPHAHTFNVERDGARAAAV